MTLSGRTGIKSSNALMKQLFIAGYLILLAAFGQPLQAAPNLPDFTDLVEKWQGSVVNVSAIHKSKKTAVDPFEEYFRQFSPRRTFPRSTPRARSLGSGFIIASDGFVLTNAHVIEGADHILVRLSDRRELVAEVVGVDEISDIALLKINASGLPAVRIGRSSDVRVGEWVLAIGSPFEFDYSVTAGVVSALGRSLPAKNNANYVPFIQTDVAINPGNSGGPLFNLEGEVIGINSQIYTRTGAYVGLSFAIPIAVAIEIVDQLKAEGRVSRGYLGVVIQEVSFELAESFGLKRPQGALINKIVPNSPAEEGGLKQGDIVVAVNGEPINVSADLPHIVGRIKPDTDIPLSIIRNKKSMDLEITLGELVSDNATASRFPLKQADDSDNLLALQVRALTSIEKRKLKRLGWDSEIDGLLVEEVAPGPAARAGITRGDILISIDGVSIDALDRLHSIVKNLRPRQKVPVYLIRGEAAFFVALQLSESDLR